MKSTHKKENETKRPRGFRCNMQSIISWVSDNRQQIPEGHIAAVMKTPFGGLFEAIYDEIITVDTFGRTSRQIAQIISLYSAKDDCFHFGKKKVKLTVEDVAVTFGLPAVGKDFVLLPGPKFNKGDSEFMLRIFGGFVKLNKATISRAMDNSLTTKGDEAAEDFARLVILYLMATLFLPNANQNVASSFIQNIEKFSKISKIAWAKCIHDNLMTNIRRHHKDPMTTPGCVIQLLVSFYRFS